MKPALILLPLLHIAITVTALSVYFIHESRKNAVGDIQSQTYLHGDHSYLLFKSEGGRSFSIVHDPSCMSCRAERLVFPSPRREDARGLGSAPEKE